jgi:ketosteroid isomerase-like protein
LNNSAAKEKNIFPTLRAVSNGVHMISATYSGIDRETGAVLDLPMVFLVATTGTGSTAKITRIDVAFDIVHYTHAVTCQTAQFLGCTLRSPLSFYRKLLAGQSVAEDVSPNIRVISHGKEVWEFAHTGIYNGLAGLQTWANLYRANVVGLPTIYAENVLTAVNGTGFELTISARVQPNPAYEPRQITMKMLHIMSFDNQGRIATIDEFSDSMDEINLRVCPNPTEVLGCVTGSAAALDAVVATAATPLSTYVSPASTPAAQAAWNFFSKLTPTGISTINTLLRDDVVVRLPKTVTGFGTYISGKSAVMNFFVQWGLAFTSGPSDAGFPPTVRSADQDTAIATSYVDGLIRLSGNTLKTPIVWIFTVDPTSQLISEIEWWFDITQWTYRYMCSPTHRLACTSLSTQAPAFNPPPQQALPNGAAPSATPLPVGGSPTTSAAARNFAAANALLGVSLILLL